MEKLVYVITNEYVVVNGNSVFHNSPIECVCATRKIAEERIEQMVKDGYRRLSLNIVCCTYYL